MAKQNPVFVNSDGELEKVDGTTDTLNEALIQTANSSRAGIMSAADYVTAMSGGSGGSGKNLTYTADADSSGISQLDAVTLDSSGDFTKADSDTDAGSRVLGIIHYLG